MVSPNMETRTSYRLWLCIAAFVLLTSIIAPVAASPAPVSGCPPCEQGFVQATADHGLETKVQHSEAAIRVHTNGSATWTVRVVPTNTSILNPLAENQTLARAVARNSFGTRYGNGIHHELLSTTVVGDTVVIRYRTLGVVEDGPFGTHLFTYFRDSPGAYVYTDLGADKVTVIAPPGMTVANGFGEVNGRQMTATELPHVRDGPFVAFAPRDSALPGLYGLLGITSALGGVLLRNAFLFVVLPAGLLVSGLAGIRRTLHSRKIGSPGQLGTLVSAIGGIVVLGTVMVEGSVFPAITGNLVLGTTGGLVLLLLGVGIGVPAIREYLSGLALVGGGIVVGILGVIIGGKVLGAGGFVRTLSLSVALFPIVTAQGWFDAKEPRAQSPNSRRLYIGTAVAIVTSLGIAAPLTALGSSLFLLVPILLTVGAGGVLVAAVPLYLLGAAGARANDD